MKITVFGSSAPKEGEKEYNDAYQLGMTLAHAGHTVITGGYMGTMEAVSRGAVEHGGHAIGITCGQIEAWRSTKANPWVREEIMRETLLERIETLINMCDGAIVLPGGPGTLTELSVMWNLMGIDAIPRKPLILIGSSWESAVGQIFASFDNYYQEKQRGLLQFVDSNEFIIEKLKTIQ